MINSYFLLFDDPNKIDEILNELMSEIQAIWDGRIEEV